MLRMVVIKVINETRSGSVPNCRARRVVLAAVGIADWIINTVLYKSSKGINETITAATKGDTAIRIMVAADTKRYATFFLEITASCIPNTT